ncbi:MAG: Hint domain-containing protein [Pseudomonadota bacterium]
MSGPSPLSAPGRCAVLPAAAFRVELGALAGDPIGGMTDVVAGDIYALDAGARPRELILARHARGLAVAPGSSVGVPDQPVRPLARHQVMADHGACVEVLMLDIDGDRSILPLGPLSPDDRYTLISSAPADGELAGAAQVSFVLGTRVMLATGHQVPVEALRPGDRVRTRDHGAQAVRWIGRQTVWAEGMARPVVVPPGILDNDGELRLSPDHRLFVPPRDGITTIPRREVLVRACHLVGRDGIDHAAAGYVDYVHLLFDAHEIVYVEGLPAESLLISPDVLAGLEPGSCPDGERSRLALERAKAGSSGR